MTDTANVEVDDINVEARSNVSTLQSAFPDVDRNVISAVLSAASGNVNKAFDALLGMSDPNFSVEPPVQSDLTQQEQEKQRQQIETDAELARQLAFRSEHTNQRARRAQEQNNRTSDSVQERSFLDDDLPIIKENIIQGFNETKTKVNTFLTNLRSQYAQRLDSSGEHATGTSVNSSSQQNTSQRKSMQYEADPDAVAVLEDDFDQLQMEDHTSLNDARPEDDPAQLPPKPKWQPLETSDFSRKSKDKFAVGDDDEA